MGAACSSLTDEERQSKAIDAQLMKDGRRAKREVKLLLLGPGESGKSTIFKQLKIIQEGGGYTDEELKAFRFVVFSNCVTQMRVIVQAAKKLTIPLEIPSNQEYADLVLSTKATGGNNWDRQMGEAIQALWQDKGIQSCYQLRDKHYQLNDSAEYFFSDVHRFFDANNYIPSEQDVLRARVRSTGIEEAQFKFEDIDFRLLDVGGQRNERRKWIHCFDEVTAVLFTTSLSEYDQTLREDNTQNRMKESLLLFDEICNSPWFREVAFVLFLNKMDLFEEKIKTKELTVCFANYKGGHDVNAGREFIRDRFLELNESPHQIFPHFTIAIDTENVKVVFRVVRTTLLKDTLTTMF